MATVSKPSTEMNPKSNEGIERVVEIVNNPPAASDFVKIVIKSDQKQSGNN